MTKVPEPHRNKHRPDIAGKATTDFRRADDSPTRQADPARAGGVSESIKRHAPVREYNIDGPGRQVQQGYAAERLSKEAADAKKRLDIAKVQKSLQKSFSIAHDHSQGRDDGRK